MNKKQNRLCALRAGEACCVSELLITGSVRRRLFDLGICEGAHIECIGKSPFGDPALFLVRGKMIALRGSVTGLIAVEMGES